MIKVEGYRKIIAGLAILLTLTGCNNTKVANDPTKTTEATQEVTPTTTPEVVEEDIILSDEELIVALGDIVNEVNTTPNVTMTGDDIFTVYAIFNDLKIGTDLGQSDFADALHGYTNDNGETFGGLESLARYIATKYVNGDSNIIDLSVLFNNTKDKKAYNDFMNEFQKALATKDNELVGKIHEEFILSENNNANVKYLISYVKSAAKDLGENILYLDDKGKEKLFAAQDVIYARQNAMQENPYNEAADLSDEIDNYINSK